MLNLKTTVKLLLISCLLLCCAARKNGTSSADGADDDFTFLVAGGGYDEELGGRVKYMVSIRTRAPKKFFGDNHFCAGSIITNKHVLTAAHCVMDKRKVLTRPRRLLVVAGAPNRLLIAPTTRQFPVDDVIANQAFILYTKHDIAVIKIRGEFPTDSPAIKPITLRRTPPDKDAEYHVFGWGRLYHKGPLAAEISHVSLRLINDKDCEAALPYYYEGMLCGDDAKFYNKDPCRGDSGGPLMTVGNDELVGIIAWSTGCGSTKYPSIYTSVYHHLDWIEAALNGQTTRFGQSSAKVPPIVLLIMWLAF